MNQFFGALLGDTITQREEVLKIRAWFSRQDGEREPVELPYEYSNEINLNVALDTLRNMKEDALLVLRDWGCGDVHGATYITFESFRVSRV